MFLTEHFSLFSVVKKGDSGQNLCGVLCGPITIFGDVLMLSALSFLPLAPHHPISPHITPLNGSIIVPQARTQSDFFCNELNSDLTLNINFIWEIWSNLLNAHGCKVFKISLRIDQLDTKTLNQHHETKRLPNLRYLLSNFNHYWD